MKETILLRELMKKEGNMLNVDAGCFSISQSHLSQRDYKYDHFCPHIFYPL